MIPGMAGFKEIRYPGKPPARPHISPTSFDQVTITRKDLFFAFLKGRLTINLTVDFAKQERKLEVHRG